MRLNIRWITILTLLALFLACAWGVVLLSQNFLEIFDTEEEAEFGRDGRVDEADDDADRASARDRNDNDANTRENDDDRDDDDANVRESDDDDTGGSEVENRITGSIPVSPGTNNPENLAELSAAEVEEIALEEAPEAQLEELGLEVENGYLVYEVELTNGMEIIVDAGNGDILQTKAND